MKEEEIILLKKISSLIDGNESLIKIINNLKGVAALSDDRDVLAFQILLSNLLKASVANQFIGQLFEEKKEKIDLKQHYPLFKKFVDHLVSGKKDAQVMGPILTDIIILQGNYDKQDLI